MTKTNLTYQARKLATKATILADNLTTHVAELDPRYRDFLDPTRLRSAMQTTSEALAAYESNHDHKQALADAARNNLKSAIASKQAEHRAHKESELGRLVAERAALLAAAKAKSAEIATKEAELLASSRAELTSIRAEGQSVVAGHERDAKAFDASLRTAYETLHKTYLECKNIVEAAAVSQGKPELISVIVPRETRATRRVREDLTTTAEPLATEPTESTQTSTVPAEAVASV